eukprot:gene7333-6893_t
MLCHCSTTSTPKACTTGIAGCSQGVALTQVLVVYKKAPHLPSTVICQSSAPPAQGRLTLKSACPCIPAFHHFMPRCVPNSRAVLDEFNPNAPLSSENTSSIPP